MRRLCEHLRQLHSIRFGVGLARNRGVLPPYAGLSMGRGGSGTVRADARWNLAGDVCFDVEGTPRQGPWRERIEVAPVVVRLAVTAPTAVV